MTNTLKRALIVAAAIALALTIPSIDSSTLRAQNDFVDDPVVAKGKGFEIKRSQLEDAFTFYRANLAAIGEKIPEERRDKIEADLFNQMVLSKLLMSKATEADKNKAKESAEKRVNELKSLFASETVFKFRLKALGLTAERFETQTYEDELRKHVLRRELGSKVVITDDAIAKFYQENSKKFELPERARATHILLLTINQATKAPLSDDAKKQKYELAKKLKARADAGEDFQKLAQEFSEDPSKRGHGAEYTFVRGDLVKPFEDAVFALKPGQISDVLEMQYGYYVVKLIDKVAASKEPLVDAAPNIRPVLVDNEIRRQLPAFYEQLKKEAGVEILDKKLAAQVSDFGATK